MYDELAIKEYESRIVDVQPMQGEILQILKEICDLNQREIVQLTGLAKGSQEPHQMFLFRLEIRKFKFQAKVYICANRAESLPVK